MSKRTILTLLSMILLISMLGCNLLSTLQATETPTITPPFEVPATETEEVVSGPSPTPPTGAKAPAFASYSKISVSLPDTFTGYNLPMDLAGVENVDFFELSATQKEMLENNGFVVASPVPGDFREFYQIYESWRYSMQPVFITTDSMLHVYHLLFDKLLRDLETRRFIPILEVLTETVLQTTQAQLDQLRGTALEEPARRNLAFFAVAAQLLEMNLAVPPEVTELVEAELALIQAHAGPSVSPIWDREDLDPDKKLIEDYSQYVPRGHYTRSDDLKRYFKTMMWYGRLTFRLREPFETQRALLITHALRTSSAPDGNSAEKLWGWIYEPTVFLVGKADDLSYFEYGALADSVFGPDASLEAFGDPVLIEAFLDAAKQLPPPQVNSMWVWIWEDTEQATKGYRFMGQRFTIDAYVLGQLIWRKVGTMDNPRGLPKALDFFAALGSEEALDILVEMGENEYENFDTQMEKVRSELGALQEDTWTENVYWSWLYALQPIIEVKDESFPEFMRTQAWTRKDLNAALGSYTELKHDTILYAKQVMAEMGGGPQDIPRGYIEPNPEAFARLKSLAEMTLEGLANRNLLDEDMLANLENLIDLLGFLKNTSEKLLWGEELTEDDYFRINFFGGELESLTIAAADCEGEEWECRDLQDQQAALIADIATGISPDSPDLVVLEEAIGQPTPIFVILPDSPYRIGVGAVFTYYEFEVPADSRMTDEEWQALVATGNHEPPPYWTESFMTD